MVYFLSLAFQQPSVANDNFFPSLADSHTVALWLFDDHAHTFPKRSPAVSKWYYHSTLTDASENRYDLYLLEGGKLVPGRFGRALEISSERISSGMGLAANYATVAKPGGTFLMGTKATDIEVLKARYEVDFPRIFENEAPAHEVTLDDFQMDRHEVTNARFRAFLKSRGREDDVEHWQREDDPDFDLRPVVGIDLDTAREFARWAGKQLPTVAQWMHAASWTAMAGWLGSGAGVSLAGKRLASTPTLSAQRQNLESSS